MSDSSWSDGDATEVYAMIELMFIVAQADSTFSVAERRAFLETVDSLSEGKLHSTELLAFMDVAEARLAEQGTQTRVTAVAQLLSDELARRVAFGLCAKLALTDDVLHDKERATLDLVARVLNISPEDDEEIVQSVRQSQRSP